MKTVSFKRLAILFALLFSVSFISCNKDEDDGIGTKEDLVGSWKTVSIEGWEMQNGIKVSVEIPNYDDKSLTTFTADGKFSIIDDSDEDDGIIGTWIFSNNKLTLTNSEGAILIFGVLKLTAVELIVEIANGTTSYEKVTFKKQ
jgi:hypothetical protein